MEYCRDRKRISEIRNCGLGTHFDRQTTRNPDRINGDNSRGTQKPTPGSLVPAEKLARRPRSHGGFLGNWQARKTPKNILNRRSQRGIAATTKDAVSADRRIGVSASLQPRGLNEAAERPSGMDNFIL